MVRWAFLLSFYVGHGRPIVDYWQCCEEYVYYAFSTDMLWECWLWPDWWRWLHQSMGALRYIPIEALIRSWLFPAWCSKTIQSLSCVHVAHVASIDLHIIDCMFQNNPTFDWWSDITATLAAALEVLVTSDAAHFTTVWYTERPTTTGPCFICWYNR